MQENRQVETAEAQAYAESIGAIYMEVSAKEDVLVTDMFVTLSRGVPARTPSDGRGGIYLAAQPRAKDRLGAACC